MADDPTDTLHLVERLRAGDRQALTDLFQRHRDRLRRMVDLRMDTRLQGRVDPSDVVQDVCLEAWQHPGSYVSQPSTPFFLWLRTVAGHKWPCGTSSSSPSRRPRRCSVMSAPNWVATSKRSAPIRHAWDTC